MEKEIQKFKKGVPLYGIFYLNDSNFQWKTAETSENKLLSDLLRQEVWKKMVITTLKYSSQLSQKPFNNKIPLKNNDWSIKRKILPKLKRSAKWLKL